MGCECHRKKRYSNARYKIQNILYSSRSNMQDTRYNMQDTRFTMQDKGKRRKESILQKEKFYKNYAVVLCTVEVFGNKSKNTFIILSPGCNPCCAAGLPGCTAVTNIPLSLPPKHQTVKSRLNSRNINLIGSNTILIEYVTNKSIKLSYKI